ncbi:Succinyl-CoA ligase [ADP-forming] subunit beta [Candidatus Mikella endobia]|uniref:Succinate--CoA ligase [ADP-forming] subunit beta n=1 Tax=Candidatus Mikella endobia TaxID=1778264 RepID=A0A143WQ27_9ENTR|nr:ADP-forming succinate--CoA ligase subunit beta [Candidatus Mikella endobia]CUX95838.1 Succinyl-CoA ligase [ADP-forming] subunit beta [Candidatus Mikella endobia]
MNLYEYQSKQLFTKYGLPIPIGYICNSLIEVEELSSKIIFGNWIAKCQIYAGGRGKAGGVKVIKSKEELICFAKQWLGKRLITSQTDTIGQIVNSILVETATYISKELYLGVVIDRSISSIVFLASTEGGIEIEQIAEKTPHLIHKIKLDQLMGPQFYQGRKLAFQLGLSGKQVSHFIKIFMGLATLFLERDLDLVEINPLVITNNNDLICLDSKLSVDNNALFRQSELRNIYNNSYKEKSEKNAVKLQLNYIALEDGNIGCMVNGAGLAMGTMDIIKLYGGQPANFLDIGGGATKERVTEAFKLILLNKKVKAILVNIFGGIVRCDLIADGIISALSKININIPVIVRLEGNNAPQGIKLLANSMLNIIAANNLIDAVKQVIAVVKDK